MINKKVMIVVGVFLGSSLAIAGTVIGLNTFTAGAPAVANNVNANFSVIKVAVDDNNTRITTNTGAVGSNTTSVTANTTAVSGLQSAATLVRTVMVEPVIAAGVADPVASGSALINAVAGIVGASPTNPYLVKLGTGVFDLGAQMLILPDGVSLEGAGRTATTITSLIPAGNTVPRSASVRVSGSSSISNLTVKNSVVGVNNAAIAVTGATAAANLYYVDASGGTAALTEAGASLKVYHSTMTANRIETLWLTSAADSVDVVNTGMTSNLAYYIFAGRTMRCFGAHDNGTFAALNNVTCL